MKTTIICLLLALTAGCFAQLTPQEKLLYTQKVSSFESMRKTGNFLCFTGLVGLAGGIYLYKQGNQNMNSQDIDKIATSTSQLTAGYCLIGVGGTMFITGIILSNTGSRKMKEYQERLNLGLIIDKNQAGMMLVYRF
jgi:hypothetical protein